MNPALPQLVMMLAALAGLVAAVWIGGRIVRGLPARRSVVAALAGTSLYLAALLGVSIAGGSRDLRPGDTKCFDEWCATLVRAQATPNGGELVIQTRLDNHGARAQRSLLARAFIDAGGKRRWPENESDLQALVPAGGSIMIAFRFTLPPSSTTARFVVTEAVSGSPTPAAAVIGDESSPLHGLAGWPLLGQPGGEGEAAR
jgi:hypothetical protein